MINAGILTAVVQPVQIGVRTIKGLMDEKGSYYIGVPQICDFLALSKTHGSRDIKTLLGKSLSAIQNDDIFVKLKVPEINSYPINAICLKHFEVLLLVLDREKDNSVAKEFRDALVGLSLHQLFCDAFGVKFEQEERQEWLKARMMTKETFWFMGSAIQRYYAINPRQEKYPCQNYSEAFDALNLALFGKRSRDIKKILGIDKGELNRDHFGEKSLKKIEMIQRIAEAQIDHCSKKPVDAVKFAVGVMNYQVGDFKE